MANLTKNDIAWEKAFEEIPILDEINQKGFYHITAKTINMFREARLMTKFDHRLQLPKIFKKHKLTIQPNSRSSYIIGRFDSYADIVEDSSIETDAIKPNKIFETLDPSNLYSESSAILCAYHTGIIDEVLNGDTLLTVLGRMSTGKFNYFIKNKKPDILLEINVENSQCEIDAGFEGDDFFAIVEAKNTSVDDFLIRQLYYPFRLWTTKTRKEVIPLFMTYSNEVFSFYKFRFADKMLYNSIELVSEHKFQIIPNEIGLQELIDLLRTTKQVPEPKKIPFPQANSFPRVIDLLMQLKVSGNELTKEQITTEYDFDARQTQYYTNAAKYLGLIDRFQTKEKGVFYRLTSKGLRISNLAPQMRNLALCESILEHPVFNQVLRQTLEEAYPSSRQKIIEIMQKSNLNLDKDGYSTIPRRSSTVISWVNWMIKLTNESPF